MVEDVLVNRNVKFSLEIVNEVCGELSIRLTAGGAMCCTVNNI